MHDNTTELECDSWDYAKESLVSKFNLVCSNRYWVPLSQSVYMLGYVAGSAISGVLSDKFGRRPVIIVSTIGYLVSGLVLISSQTIISTLATCKETVA